MNILHLTDLHFNDQKEEQVKWAELLWRISLVRQKHKVDYVAVTGDLTCHGREAEFQMAAEFFHELLQMLKLRKDKIGFCAGNHDADKEEMHSSFEHYESFVKKFYEKEQNEEEYCLKGKRKDYHFFSTNTCLNTSLELYDNAYLCAEIPEWVQTVHDPEYGILLMHHQPEVIKNQEVFRQMTRSGHIKLILCGHLHPEKARVYPVDEATVVNGMGITPHLDFIPSGFQLVHIGTEGKISVYTRTME